MDCDICCDHFRETKEPKILTRCGHTICSDCIESIRRTSGNDISCPHCRVITRIDDIRTNFAIKGLLDEPDRRKDSERPMCLSHTGNRVVVFCVPCSQFLCQECFETVDAVHSTHARISFSDGIGRIHEKLEHTSDTCERIREQNTKQIEDLHKLHQEMARLNDTCVAHYNRVVEMYTSQLLQVQGRLKECERQLQERAAVAVNKLNTAKAIEQLVTRIKNDVPTNLGDYMNHRDGIEQCLLSMNVDGESIRESLDQVTIGDSVSVNVNYAAVLPRISLSFPDSYQLFKIEESDTRPAILPRERIKRRTLHRTTSNDELKN